MGAWLKPNLGRRDRRSDSFAAPGTAPVFDAFCGCQPPFRTHCLFAQHRGPLPTAAESVGFFMGELRTTCCVISCYRAGRSRSAGFGGA
jgi:hypothetical protein